jgi:23S rRNA pseudouridine1911/1915/1917 synthase
MEKKISLIVGEEDQNTRVDTFINKHNKEISRTRIKNLILDKNLKINNRIVEDPSKKLFLNDNVFIQVPEPKKTSLKPFKYNLNIIYEDHDLMVINKPAGIVMHPGAGNYDNTIVNALISYDKKLSTSIGDELRPGIVHRIDKNTSGLVDHCKK